MFYKSRSATKGIGTAVQNNDDLGEINFDPEGGAGPVDAALINSSVDGSVISPTSVPTRLMFWTMPAGSNYTLERMRITSAGNVGIGTTTPTDILDVNGNIGIPYGGGLKADVNNNYLGQNILTTGWNGSYDTLYLYTPGGATGDATPKIAILGGNGSGNGNVGIGTTSPDTLLSVGSATPVGSVAHFENSTGSCYINPTTTSLSCSSDARLKTNVVPLSSDEGLAALLKLDPITFNWKTESATSSPHTGFIAQDVQPIFPDLVSQGPDGYYTLNYAGFTPYLVKAVQEIASVSGVFEQNLIAWLGSATNGIGDLYAAVVHAHQVEADELCAGTVCVNQQQLATILAAANQSASAAASPLSSASAAPDTPPVIAINGDNPATIQVGASYTDLGATITGPQADLNLGIATFVNGAPTNPVQIDTSAAATDTIDYVVTDSQGLTSTSTRTAVIEAANDNHASSMPANDNGASTTLATSTAQ
jgi:hypothetical protein